MPEFQTPSALAHRFGVATHQILYLLRSRRIAPAGRYGNARVFDPAAVAIVEAELRRIRERKGGAV